MPTYSYQCESCQHKFDQFQYMSEDPLKTCPECSKDSLKRLIGPGAGFIFKGDGFYITDYRSKNYQDKAKSESSTSSDTKSESTTSKSESTTSKSESTTTTTSAG